MNRSDKEYLIKVRADILEAVAQIKSLAREVDRSGNSSAAASRKVNQLDRSSKNLTGTMGELSTALRSAAAGFGAWKVGQIIKDSTLLSARIETLGVVLNVVGRNTGHTRGEMAGYTADVKNAGITTAVATQTVIRMAQANLDLSQAARLARVAQDAAVVGNINSSEALQRLLYGITTLQPEMLRTIGITLNFQQEYELAAKQINRNVNSLSANEKQQIALNAALREGERLAGAYSDALQTVGKQLGSLDRITKTTEEELGNLFKPALAVGVSAWQKIVEQAGRNLRDFNLVLGTTGLETKPLAAVDAEVKRLTDSIAKLREEQTKSGAYSGYGDNAWILQLRFQLQEVEDIRAKMLSDPKLLGARLAAYGQIGQTPINPPPQPGDVGPPAPSAGVLALREKIQGLTKDFRDQAATLGFGTEAMIRYRLTAGDLQDTEKGLADQLVAAARALDKKRTAQAQAQQDAAAEARRAEILKRNAEADKELIGSLQEQIMLYGLSDREQSQYQATSKLSANATDAERRAVASLAGALDDISTQRERAAQLKANNQSDQAYIDSLARELSLVTATGKQRAQADAQARLSSDATAEQRKAVEALSGALADAKDEAKGAFGDMTQFAVQAARNIQQEFSNVLFDAMQGKFDNLGQRFKAVLDRMAADIAASQIATLLLGNFGNTGKLGGLIGNLFSPAPVKAAEGGYISGPGSSTSDSINARLSNGEFVMRAAAVQRYGLGFMEAINRAGFPTIPGMSSTVWPRTSFASGGAVRAGGGRGDVIVQQFINTPDAASFRRSEMQIGQRAGEAARRAMARNS